MVNQKNADLGIPNRFSLTPSRFKVQMLTVHPSAPGDERNASSPPPSDAQNLGNTDGSNQKTFGRTPAARRSTSGVVFPDAHGVRTAPLHVQSQPQEMPNIV